MPSVRSATRHRLSVHSAVALLMLAAPAALAALLLTMCVRVSITVATDDAAVAPGGPPIGSIPAFDFESLDARSVSAPAFRGKPAVLVFLISDSLAGQAEVDIVARLAKDKPDAARYAFVAVEPPDRRELVEVFRRFFEDKSGVSLLGAMADKDTLLGVGPFGEVRGLTVIVLDAGGRIVMRRAGVTSGVDIARVLGTM